MQRPNSFASSVLWPLGYIVGGIALGCGNSAPSDVPDAGNGSGSSGSGGGSGATSSGSSGGTASSGSGSSGGSGSGGASGSSGSSSGGSGGSGSSSGVTGSSSGTGGGSGSGSSGGVDGGASDGGSGIEEWHPTVLSFTSTGTYTNQYMQNAMAAIFTGPGGVMLKIPGYYTTGTAWAVRFSPPAIGTWTYTTQSTDAGLNGKTGTINCIANTNPNLHGALRTDTADPTHLKYEDGTQYFQLQYEADWLGLLDLGATDTPAAHAKALIDTISSNGFHEVLMNMFAYDTPWGSDSFDFGPTKAYPWGGTNTAPVHGQINPIFFDRFDAVMDYLFLKGITSHLYFTVSNKLVNWPAQGSAEDDKYFQYVVARYQAYPNVVWDIAKETFHYPSPYIQGRVALIKAADAYQRLRTTHAPINGGAQAGGGYWFSSTPNNLDFYTAEAVGATYANTRQAMTTVGGFPYANAESSYQIGNDGTTTYSQTTQSAAQVHAEITEQIMAGAGAAYYYAYHAWDDCRYAEVPTGIAYFKNLSNVFTKQVTLAGLTADDTLIGGGGAGKHCLAQAGKQYVVELSAGTTVSLNVTPAPAGGGLAATWYDLDLGATMAASPAMVTAAGMVSFTKPFSGAGILVVK